MSERSKEIADVVISEQFRRSEESLREQVEACVESDFEEQYPTLTRVVNREQFIELMMPVCRVLRMNIIARYN